MMKDYQQFLAYQRKRVARKKLPQEEREKSPVRIWRKKYELSQRQMGALLGVSGTCIGYWESGIAQTPGWVLDLVDHPADGYILDKMAEVLK